MDYEIMWNELKEKINKGKINLGELLNNAYYDDEIVRLDNKINGVSLVEGWMLDLEKVHKN